jgi:hypothetical protein
MSRLELAALSESEAEELVATSALMPRHRPARY